jgi:hypothetical protein
VAGPNPLASGLLDPAVVIASLVVLVQRDFEHAAIRTELGDARNDLFVFTSAESGWRVPVAVPDREIVRGWMRVEQGEQTFALTQRDAERLADELVLRPDRNDTRQE